MSLYNPTTRRAKIAWTLISLTAFAFMFAAYADFLYA